MEIFRTKLNINYNIMLTLDFSLDVFLVIFYACLQVFLIGIALSNVSVFNFNGIR